MTSKLRKLLVAFILTLTLGIGLTLAWRDSMTTDEGIHVASAYLVFTRQEFRFDPEHPYTYKYLTALPLLFLKPNMPPDDAALWEGAYPTVYDSWKEAREWTDQWFYRSGNNADLMIFLARIPGIFCLVGLCWLVYYLASRWFSEKVGLYALVFTAFNPTVLAHGHLANNDVAAALAFLGTVWALWHYSLSPSLKRAALVGLILGIAQTTKFSLLLLMPITFLWLVYLGYLKMGWKRAVSDLAIIGIIVWAIIWLSYLMPLSLIRGTAFSIRGSQELPEVITIGRQYFKYVLALRYVLPIDYVKGVMLVLGSSAFGRTSYLLGHSVFGGLWYYFPVVFLLKTQLIGLLLLAIGLVVGIKRHFNPRAWTPLTVLLLGCVFVYASTSMVNKLNLGIRHILPLLPFASMAMALSLAWLTERYSWKHLSATIISLYILPIIISSSNLIGFGNLLVSPPHSYRYFNDSNLDWGNQAKKIAAVVRDHYGNEPLFVNNNWNPYALGYYGVTVKRYDPFHPPVGGLIAVTGTQMTYPEWEPYQHIEPDYILDNTTYFFRLVRPLDEY